MTAPIGSLGSRRSGWALLAGTAAVVGLSAFTLQRYPATLDDPAAPAYLALLGAVLLLYAALAGWSLRRRSAGPAPGLFVGFAAGAMWASEIWAGGAANLSHPGERAVGTAFSLLAVLVTLSAGVLVAAVQHDSRAACQAGVIAGLASGIVVFCFGTVMTLATLGARRDYQQQYRLSSAPDLATFLVGDILAAVVAHLVINLLLGAMGGLVGLLIARPAPDAPMPHLPDGTASSAPG
jgi:hypothetical protein